MAPDMGNIDDNKIEDLIVFVRATARLKLYGSEIKMPGEEDGPDANDAIQSLNGLILVARILLN